MKKNAFATMIIILIICLPVLSSCKGKETIVDEEFSYSYYNLRYDYSYPLTAIEPDLALSSDYSTAFDYLIETVKSNLTLLPYASRIAVMQGNTTPGKMGSLSMIASSIFIFNTDSWYFHNMTKISASNPDFLLPLMQPSLDTASRHYWSEGQKVTIQEPAKRSDILVKADFPYTACDFTKGKIYSRDISNTMDYKAEFVSLGNFMLSSETVDISTLRISKSEHGYYTVSFELDLSDQTAKDSSTFIQREIFRKMSKIDSLEFDKVNFTLEVWSNGLPKSILAYEEWSGPFRVLLLDMTIKSMSNTAYYYSYHPDDADYASQNIDISWATAQ